MEPFPDPIEKQRLDPERFNGTKRARVIIGAIANVGIAAYLLRENEASWPIAALAGIFVGSVWNYPVTSVCT